MVSVAYFESQEKEISTFKLFFKEKKASPHSEEIGKNSH